MVVRRRKTLLRRRVAARSRAKKGPGLTFEVEKHIAREIGAVIHLAIAALTWLSLNQQLGFLGELWVATLRPVFGIGLQAVPFVLLFMGVSVFVSKKISWGLARLTGLFLLTVAVLGFIHMAVPADQILEVARAGKSGGYFGFVSSFLFTALFGRVGAYVLLTATLLIGFLLTLQVSLASMVRALIPSPKSVKKAVNAVTPEFELLEHDDTEDEEELRIVHPLIDEDDEDALSIREVSEDEMEDVLDESSDVDGEIVLVDQKVELPQGKWEYPSLDLLAPAEPMGELNPGVLKAKATMIKSKLEQFGIDVSMHEVHVGPTVIQYTLRPADGVKLSKITSLKNDLALALAASAVRIEAPIPGKSLVGIEVPNEVRSSVRMREMMETPAYKQLKSDLKLALGRDVSGTPMVADLAKMPHLLIAGATGSGKSVGMNSFLISMLYNNSPRELKFIMIDPKQVELSLYNGLPHLLTPVITDAEKAATALRWAVAEMNRRYKVCAEGGHRNIDDYNRGKREADRMSKIVIVIDELADLMMQAQKEVEASICRLAQMARAVGMHLMVATQRPSVDVITGLIKANIPARIAFTVTSSVDSRTILDAQGAEDLLGQGDMLFLSGTMGKPIRIQGIYISTDEVTAITNRLKLTLEGEPHYLEDITSKEVKHAPIQGIPDMSLETKTDDELIDLAVECLKKNRKAASTSSMQRYLKIGYARAARIMDSLEERGLVGPAQGSKVRDVYLGD